MQLVGVIVGTYSSIFFATPLLVTLRERTELVRTHTRRVLNRRKPAARGRRGRHEATDDRRAERRRSAASRRVARQASVAEQACARVRGPIRPTSQQDRTAVG